MEECEIPKYPHFLPKKKYKKLISWVGHPPCDLWVTRPHGWVW